MLTSASVPSIRVSSSESQAVVVWFFSAMPLAAVFAALILGLLGCSALVTNDQQVVVCHATKEPIQCAPTDSVPRALRVFSKYVGPIPDDTPLVVHWYDWDHEFGDRPGDVVGYTDENADPIAVHVRNSGVLMHELGHVFLLLAVGDPDVNHEEPGGAWGNAMNAGIEAAGAAFGTTNGTPCPAEVCDAD